MHNLTEEKDLYNLTDAKLRAYGVSERMIEAIKKTIEELTIVRKIMHGDAGISKMKEMADDKLDTLSEWSTTTEETVIQRVKEQVLGNKQEPEKKDIVVKKVCDNPDSDEESIDEDTWDSHGMGR